MLALQLNSVKHKMENTSISTSRLSEGKEMERNHFEMNINNIIDFET